MKQSNYSDSSLSLCLDNYWNLWENILPGDASSSGLNRSPFESCAILLSDINCAINALTTDCRWNEVLEAMNAYYSDGTAPQYLFEDKHQYFHMLNKPQKAIVKYHFKVVISRKAHKDYFLDEDEFFAAMKARKAMLRYLNSQVTPREWELVNKLVGALGI